MYGIRNNIAVSVMLHTLMFAAAFIAGSSSEFRSTRIISVSLVEGWGSESAAAREHLPAQQLSRKTRGEEVVSRNPAGQGASPLASRSKDQPQPSTEKPGMRQSSSPEVKEAGPEDSSAHMTGSLNAGRPGSPADPGTDVVSPGSSQGNTSSAPVAAGGGQRHGSAGDASLRQKIRAALQANLVYPYIARKRQMEGSVMVSFRINQAGKPEAIRIIKGSGYSILDSAAQETVVKASPFPASNNFIEVPITFTLKDP